MRINRRTIATIAPAIGLALLGSSCSVTVDDGQVSFVDSDAQLLCAEGGALTLAAQTVPSAMFVPCIAEMPSGWSVDYTDFDNDGVTIGLDSRRAPIDDMVVTFAETCTPGTQQIALSDDPSFPADFDVSQDTDGLDLRIVLAGTGACTELHIMLDSPEAVGLDDFPTLDWVPRTVIDAGVAEATDDRLRLDP